MKKIRLVHVVNNLSVGGVSRVLLDLCDQADLNKYDISIICLSSNLEMLHQSPLRKGIDLFTFKYFFDTFYTLRRYLYLTYYKRVTAKRSKQVIDKIIQIQPDIIHFHILPRELMIGHLILEVMPEVKMVFTDHLMRIGEDDYSYINRALLKIAYRKLYSKFNVISVSKSVERSNRMNGFLSQHKKHRLIENRIDCSKYDLTKKASKQTVNVVYVARLSIVKGHMDLLKAWEVVSKKWDCKLFLIGDGELYDELFQYSEKYIDNGSVVFAGSVDNVTDFLQISDFAVFPSYKEGLPMALLEQAVIGLPVVASDIPELTDIIEHETHGLIFKVGNVPDLINKLEIMIDNKLLRLKYGENIKKMALSRFCNKDFGYHYEKFYDEILGT